MTGMDSTPVEIPAEVVAAWCQGADVDWELAKQDVALISEPVVVAELRRLIAKIDGKREVTGAQRYRDGYFDGSSMVYDLLCDRADEIERARDGETP